MRIKANTLKFIYAKKLKIVQIQEKSLSNCCILKSIMSLNRCIADVFHSLCITYNLM